MLMIKYWDNDLFNWKPIGLLFVFVRGATKDIFNLMVYPVRVAIPVL